MNGMRGPSGPLLRAAAAYLAALCVLSAAQSTTTPTPTNSTASLAPSGEPPSPEPNATTTQPPTTSAPAPDSCGNHTNCSSCLDNKNVTCFWILCDGKSYCSNSGNETSGNCTVVNNSSSCLVIPTTVPTPTRPTDKPSPSPSNTTAVTTIVTSGTPNTTVTPIPSTRKSTFDAASFIGGIVLVLGVQAVVFFLYKFCKSKERNYHTL